jgi:hypothetical protein
MIGTLASAIVAMLFGTTFPRLAPVAVRCYRPRLVTMRTIGGRLGVLALVTLAWMSPAWARTVKIETQASLADRSDRAVDEAMKQAVDNCVQRATAMGLSWIWLDNAAVLGDAVIVKMVATDEDVDNEGDEVRVMDLGTRREPVTAERPL